MLLLSAFTAFAAPRPPAWSTLEGPWANGGWVDLAVAGDGAVHAVWIDATGALRWAAGPAWGVAETVAPKADTGDGGQVRPHVALDPAGQPVVLYAVGETSWLARRGPGGWARAEAAKSALADLTVADGEPVVAWLDARGGASIVRVGEAEVYRSGEDGVCMCCRPALYPRADGLALAVRDADGPRRDVRLLVRRSGTWTDTGDATHGRWSPGGCPADGPALTADALYVSDARDGKRRIWRSDARGESVLPLLDPSSEAVQPRATPDGQAVFWLEVRPGGGALVLLEGATPMRVAAATPNTVPGDPVVVGRELWIPTQDETARVLVQR